MFMQTYDGDNVIQLRLRLVHVGTI